MKEKIQQIIISAQLGGISSNEAAQQVLDLFAVSGSLPDDKIINKAANNYQNNETVNKMGIEKTAFENGAKWMRDLLRQ